MSHVLTDVDSFDSPAAVPDDGDTNSAASVVNEFQVLQNRSTYNKNRQADANAAFNTLNGQLVGGLAVVSSTPWSYTTILSDSQTANTWHLVAFSSITISALVGDVLRINGGPFQFLYAGTGGTARIRVEIVEDNTGTPTVHDFDSQPVDPLSIKQSFTIQRQFTVAHAGVLSVAIWIEGDGTDALHFYSVFPAFGWIELLRVIT